MNQNDRDNESPDQQDVEEVSWEHVFAQLPIEPALQSNHQAALKDRMLGIFDQTSGLRPSSRISQLGSIVMKYKIPHWTTACLFIATAIWFFNFPNKSVFALEDVAHSFAKSKTAKFQMVIQVAGLPEQNFTAYYMAPGHFRQELGPVVNISDWTQGKMIGLNSTTREATVIDVTNFEEHVDKRGQLNPFEFIHERLTKAAEDSSIEIENLGEKLVDGQKQVGFRLLDHRQPMIVWADPATKLPIRIESTMSGPPRTKVIMTDYQFNIELDEQLFRMEIPDGYKKMELAVDASPATEEEFIESLKTLASVNEGRFPEGLDAAAIAAFVGEYVSEQIRETGEAPGADVMQKVGEVSRGLQFTSRLSLNADVHYAGRDVKSGDQEAAIFWYKPVGSEKYRVIFGDFSVKEYSKPPHVEGALKLN